MTCAGGGVTHTQDEANALMRACKGGHLEAVQELLELPVTQTDVVDREVSIVGDGA